VITLPDPLNRAGAWGLVTETARNLIGAEGWMALTKRDRFLFQGVIQMVARTFRSARLIVQGVANGRKRPASKLIQSVAAYPVTRGYLRDGVAMKQGQHGLDAQVLRRR
jgi:hypothetical protein